MPSADDIAAAVAALRAGDVVGLPTETVYGLAADASNAAAVARIFEIKGRPAAHPVIVHVGDPAHVSRWARDVPHPAAALIGRFWPGPLTLVLPRVSTVLPEVTGGQDTVALRMPAHPVALEVLRAFGAGLAAPSANRYGRISPTTAAHVRADLGDDVRIVLDGGPSDVGLESTIVACLEGRVALLRPGRITREDVEAVVGPLAGGLDAVPRVPGSVASHYAPHTRVELVEESDIRDAAAVHAAAGRRVAILATAPPPQPTVTAAIVAHAEAEPYGQALYGHLRALDAAGADVILIARPVAGPEWAAIHDRLERAAARQR